jgi:hypothetical protein
LPHGTFTAPLVRKKFRKRKEGVPGRHPGFSTSFLPQSTKIKLLAPSPMHSWSFDHWSPCKIMLNASGLFLPTLACSASMPLNKLYGTDLHFSPVVAICRPLMMNDAKTPYYSWWAEWPILCAKCFLALGERHSTDHAQLKHLTLWLISW